MANEPTPSKAVNTLVALASQVAQGQADPEALAQVLSERLEILQASREDFEKKADAMGEGFTIPHAELVDRVSDCYDAYEQALQIMQKYFQSKKVQDLDEGSQRLIDITVPMTETVQEYITTLVTFGPYPYPWLNAAINVLRSIVEQGVPIEALTTMVGKAVEQTQTAIDEIDRADEGKKDGYQIKRKAFVEVIAALKDLKPVLGVDEIDAAIAPLKSAYDMMGVADDKIFDETVAYGPTAMPSANVVINTARGVLAGLIPVEVMGETLTWYQAYLEVIEEQFNAAVEGETDSVVILEELPRTRELIDEHEEIIQDLIASLESFDKETVEPLLIDLVEIVERLKDTSEVYLDVAKREGKAVCVACGHPNPPTNRLCESCGQKLPQLVDPTMYAKSTIELEERSGLLGDESLDGVVTENAYRLFEACAKFFEQKSTEQEFRKAIAFQRERLEEASQTIASVKEPQIDDAIMEEANEDERELIHDNIKLFHETKYLFEEGVAEWSLGLELMEDYIETRHRPTLEEAIQKVWFASQKVHQIHRIGELAKRGLEEREASMALEQASGSGEEHYPGADHEDGPAPFQQQEYVEGEGGLA